MPISLKGLIMNIRFLDAEYLHALLVPLDLLLISRMWGGFALGKLYCSLNIKL